jgi:hypothetical protein
MELQREYNQNVLWNTVHGEEKHSKSQKRWSEALSACAQRRGDCSIEAITAATVSGTVAVRGRSVDSNCDFFSQERQFVYRERNKCERHAASLSANRHFE